MPTYSYECSSCDRVFEIEQRIVEDPLQDCPNCEGKSSLKRLIQPVAVMFRGSGFHVNDYSASEPRASEGAQAGCSGDPGACESCGPVCGD